MGRKVTDFNGTIVAPGSPYQYGQIKNDPNGTAVDQTSNGDMIQFFQRLSDFWNITLNSLPDNDVNGYQFIQALNIFVAGMGAAIAGVFNGIGSNVAVKGVGMGQSTAFCITSVAPGWFIYNDVLVYFQGGSFNSCIIPALGTAVMVVISTTDALPTATLSITSDTTTASKFVLGNMVNWSTAVGIDTMQTNITNLLAAVAVTGWTNITPAAGWATTGFAAAWQRTGMGHLEIRGVITNLSTASPALTLFTMPVGTRPAQLRRFSVTIWDNGINDFIPGYIQIDVTGIATLIFGPSFSITTTNWYIYMDSINYSLT